MCRNWRVKKKVPNKNGDLCWKQPRAVPESLVFWEGLERTRIWKILGWKGTSFHTHGPPKECGCGCVHLFNQPRVGILRCSLSLELHRHGRAAEAEKTPRSPGSALSQSSCRDIRPRGSGRRDCSLSALSDISGVPRSSVPCPLHKCNFPKCQEQSITDNTLCVSLTQ